VTDLVGKPGKLSQDEQTSDRFGGRRRKAVKRKPNLRQVWWKRPKSCQKKAQLQTGLDEKVEKLSEESPT